MFRYQHDPGKEIEGGKGDGQGTPPLVFSNEEGQGLTHKECQVRSRHFSFMISFNFYSHSARGESYPYRD